MGVQIEGFRNTDVVKWHVIEGSVEADVLIPFVLSDITETEVSGDLLG